MRMFWTDGELRAVRWLTALGLLLVAIGFGRARVAAQPAAMTPDEQVALTARLDAARRINLNTADVAAIESLPGIGRVTAERIISYRQSHGPLADVHALAQVSGMTPGLIDRIRPFVEEPP